MAFDSKKEYKEFYMPKNKPAIVNVPKANYIAVRGKGNPNEEGGAYQKAISVLYAVAYTLKMSYKTEYKIEGFFEYVVPPLEGFWWQDDVHGVDYENKDAFNWFRLFDYQILLRKRILIGQLKQQRKRKNWIVQQRNILRLMRDCVFRLCTLDCLMMNRQLLH